MLVERMKVGTSSVVRSWTKKIWRRIWLFRGWRKN